MRANSGNDRVTSPQTAALSFIENDDRQPDSNCKQETALGVHYFLGIAILISIRKKLNFACFEISC